MIKVFHAPRSRSLRVLWMCEEMGLPYEVEPANLMQPSEAFLKANPARTVPVMVDGDVVITESIAILQYLGTKYGPTPLVVQPQEPGYAEYLEFLLLGEATLAAHLTPMIRARFMAPDDQKENWTLTNNADVFVDRLKIVEARLGQSRYLAGDHFTAADISVGYALGFGQAVGLGERFPAGVSEYQQRIMSRPAFLKAAAVQ